MNRRAAGAAALLLAFVLVLAVRAVGHPGLPGSATAAPLPGPPPVGACLLLTDGRPAVVDCVAPHDLEVTAGVSADATPPTLSQCDARTAGYLPPVVVDDWLLPLEVRTTVVPAPPGQRSADRGWQVCAVRPDTGERFAGSVRGMTLETFRGDVVGRCSDDPTGPAVPCGDPHAAELLGTTDRSYPDVDLGGVYLGVALNAGSVPDAVGADLDARCTALAGRLTDSDDPTYDGQLDLRVQVLTVVPTDVPGTIRVYASCVAAGPPGRALTASVVGLGPGPLPLD
ncbi:hypothetical protein [Nakamurella deserti]|uniref:hypothetical protein n=1 Tax=Nakamurella deserti TaxID=2164074 RepID=UPI000DBE95C5|nr:hypothetical protein [Nakamurella deserti]